MMKNREAREELYDPKNKTMGTVLIASHEPESREDHIRYISWINKQRIKAGLKPKYYNPPI